MIHSIYREDNSSYYLMLLKQEKCVLSYCYKEKHTKTRKVISVFFACGFCGIISTGKAVITVKCMLVAFKTPHFLLDIFPKFIVFLLTFFMCKFKTLKLFCLLCKHLNGSTRILNSATRGRVGKVPPQLPFACFSV